MAAQAQLWLIVAHWRHLMSVGSHICNETEICGSEANTGLQAIDMDYLLTSSRPSLNHEGQIANRWQPLDRDQSRAKTFLSSLLGYVANCWVM